jgi:hypothetical protein
MTARARNRFQAEDSLCLDQSLSAPQSTIENAESNMSAPHPCQQLTRMITSYWVSRAMYIAAKLRIADHQRTARGRPRSWPRTDQNNLRLFDSG